MKRRLFQLGVCASLGLGMFACSDSGHDSPGIDTDQATLVAALAANEDGSDEAWTTASGTEPFLVRSCGFDAIVAAVIERFDADGSGDLNDEERTALVDEFGDPTARIELLTSVYDTDGDGSLEASELDALKADLEERCANRLDQLVDRFDTNGDGALDADEQAAAEDALRDRFSRNHARRIGQFDGDGDGRLGRPEQRRAGRGLRDRFEDRRDQLLARADTNGDGVIDDAEQAALDDHLRRCVRGEEPLLPGDDEPAEPAADAGVDAG